MLLDVMTIPIHAPNITVKFYTDSDHYTVSGWLRICNILLSYLVESLPFPWTSRSERHLVRGGTLGAIILHVPGAKVEQEFLGLADERQRRIVHCTHSEPITSDQWRSNHIVREHIMRMQVPPTMRDETLFAHLSHAMSPQ